jgi:hypothetical protein
MDIPLFVSQHLEHITIVLNVFIIILLILTFSVGAVSGGLGYTYLILAIIAGFVSIGVSGANRYGYLVPSSGFQRKLQ